MLGRTLFVESGLEDEYVKYLFETYRHTIVHLARTAGIGYTLLLIGGVLSGADLIDNILISGNVAVCVASSVLANSDWIKHGNKAEILVALTISLLMSSMLFSQADGYRYPADECFLQGKPIEDVEACSHVWMNFTYRQAIGSATLLLGTLWSGLMRVHVMGVVFLYEIFRLVLRSVFLTPIPAEVLLNFAALSVVIFPALLFGFAMVIDINRRKLFLLQRELRQRADNLRAQLDVAEKALEFEAPTALERRAVHAAFHGAEDLFKGVSIPFQDLNLLERIGAGTFGEVVKAEYAGATVAVKRLLRNNINDKMIDLMKAEVTLLRQLRHPNIVQFVGASWDSIANVCIVCEFVERGDLTGVLQNPMVSLSWQDPQLRMMMDITSAIAFLHSRSPPVLHRDVKPDNVLVTNSLTCKLTDFGVSKSQIENTIGMTVVGTAHFMAPEVASGSFYTGKVDVYGLSMTLLEMHTRRPIQEAHNTGGRGRSHSRNAVLHRVVKGRRPAIPADMPAPLVELMKSCWEQDPDDRPTSQEVLETLKAIQKKLWDEGGVFRSKRRRSSSPVVQLPNVFEGPSVVSQRGTEEIVMK